MMGAILQNIISLWMLYKMILQNHHSQESLQTHPLRSFFSVLIFNCGIISGPILSSPVYRRISIMNGLIGTRLGRRKVSLG